MFRHYALSPSALTRVSPSDHGGTTAALFDVACCFSAPCPCCRRHGPCELLSQSCSEIGSLHNLARFSAARSRRRARRTTVSTSEHFPGLGATVKDRGPVTIWWWYVYKYMYMCCICICAVNVCIFIISPSSQSFSPGSDPGVRSPSEGAPAATRLRGGFGGSRCKPRGGPRNPPRGSWPESRSESGGNSGGPKEWGS